MMDDAPFVVVSPSLRCGHRERGAAPTWCGRPAVCVRPGSVWELPAYRCARHATAADVPLTPIVAFRRVRLLAQVDFAAVTFAKGPAQAEAIAALDRAVTAAGGLLTNANVTSAIVRHRQQDEAFRASSSGLGV